MFMFCWLSGIQDESLFLHKELLLHQPISGPGGPCWWWRVPSWGEKRDIHEVTRVGKMTLNIVNNVYGFRWLTIVLGWNSWNADDQSRGSTHRSPLALSHGSVARWAERSGVFRNKNHSWKHCNVRGPGGLAAWGLPLGLGDISGSHGVFWKINPGSCRIFPWYNPIWSLWNPDILRSWNGLADGKCEPWTQLLPG